MHFQHHHHGLEVSELGLEACRRMDLWQQSSTLPIMKDMSTSMECGRGSHACYQADFGADAGVP
jgi:hypothetical protein